jgi:hypothetical protein
LTLAGTKEEAAEALFVSPPLVNLCESFGLIRAAAGLPPGAVLVLAVEKLPSWRDIYRPRL